MAPTKYPLSSLHLKFQTTTILLPIKITTTLQEMRIQVLQVLKESRPLNDSNFKFEPTDLPLSENDIAFYRKVEASSSSNMKGSSGRGKGKAIIIDGDSDDEDNEKETEEVEVENWEMLKDEKSGAGTWGVKEAEEIAISFRSTSGVFEAPIVIRPIEEGDDEEE